MSMCQYQVVESVPPYQPHSQGYEPESFVVDHDLPYHEEPSYEEQYKPDIYDPKPVYEEPYQPKPVYDEPYHTDPAYEEPYQPRPVYDPHPVYEEHYPPEPVYEEPYHDSYAPPHLPPSHYEYSSPNFRPPIESKPIHNKKHEIVSVSEPHHHHPPPKHNYHSNRNNKAISFLDKYLHPVQHVQLSQTLPAKVSHHHTNLHEDKEPISFTVEDPFIYEDNPEPYHPFIHFYEEKHEHKPPTRHVPTRSNSGR